MSMSSGGQKRKRSERVAALELPPGTWERVWIGVRRREVLLRLGMCLATALVLCAILRGWNPPFTSRVGHSRQYDFVARVPFEVPDALATQAARDRARRQVRCVYRNNPEPLKRLGAELHAAVASVAAAGQYADRDAQLWSEFQPPPERAASAANQDPKQQFDKFRAAVAEDKDLKLFDRAIEAVLDPFVQNGQLNLLEQKSGQGNREEIIVYPVDKPEAKKTVKVADVLIGNKSALLSSLREHLSADLADPVFEWLQRRWPTTLTLDEEQTNNALDTAVKAVEPVIVRYVPGQLLVEAKEPMRPDHIAVLRAEYDAVMALRPMRDKVYRAVAVVAFILAMFALCAFYVHSREPRLVASLQRLVLMHVLGVVTVILACWAADGWQAELVPLLLFGQTMAIAYSRELALLLSGVVAMIVMLAIGYNVNTFLLIMGVTTAAVLQLGRIRSRTKLIYVGMVSGVVAFLLSLGLGILENQAVAWPLLQRACLNALWALVAGFIMTGLLPFIERAFQVLTDISLLELGDVAHPLLQELVRRAPSTYNHSITVGSIAEAAAEAIGARGLLVRVGAYFHDIGKMLKPGYFIENQSPDENRHETLVPAMSSLVIIAHIKDGADLARQHGLPEPIVDMIQQHHGTTLVEYFYGRATEQSQNDPNGGEVDESPFRYPGPPPQTKESAVLMLADAVESASRSLVDPGPARIESLVREVAEHKLDEGQFDESNLTLRELRTIEDSMIKSLIANYHGRVKYPEQKTV